MIEYPVWIKTHAELPQVPIKVSDSHTDTQTLYYTILTIDFIIIFSSAPASPFLIFTTGTSITLMACKNQPVGSGCQTLTFRWRAFKKKKTWEGQKVETEDKCIQINPTWGKKREQGWVYGSSKEQVRKRQGGVCVLAKTVASNKYQAPEGVGRVEEETSVKN